MNKKIYEFGEFSLDLNEGSLQRAGKPVSIQPKVFDLLVYFVENHGELISRDDLMNAVWADTFVEETNLRFCIHTLRKTLGKNADGTDYIETIPKRGYRFTPEVSKKIPEIISATGAVKETSLRENTAKPRSVKRFWLIGAAAILLIGLLIGAFVWQKSRVWSPKNALGIGQLAVLPFEAVAENEREMQTGLLDSLITNLSRIKQLKVLPISSVRGFAGQNFDARQAGRELAADAVLTGTYRFEGENTRVTVKLLRVADGTTLWTEDFAATGKTELERETAVALRTARLLSLKIAEAEDEQALAGQNLNKEAVRDYLAARKIWRAGELFRREEMFGLYEKIIALEPNWALAYASYAEALLASEEFAEDKEKIKLIAEKALELDKSLPQPHAVLGESYRWFDWNWAESEAQLKIAISLDPNYALSHYKYARLLMIQRRFAESEIELKRAVDLEPFSPLFQAGLCELYSSDNKLNEAIAACNFAKQVEPGYWQVQKLLFWLYVKKEMFAELDELLFKNLSPAEKEKNLLAGAVAKKDLSSYWQKTIDEPVTNDQPVSLALFHLQIGEKERALENLERALSKHDPNLPGVNADSMFDPIRKEKRFVAIMDKIGLPG